MVSHVAGESRPNEAILGVLVALVFLSAALAVAGSDDRLPRDVDITAAPSRVDRLLFFPNQTKGVSDSVYSAATADGWVHMAKDGFTIVRRTGEQPRTHVLPPDVSEAAPGASVLRVRFMGCAPIAPSGIEPLPTTFHFMRGNDPRLWIVNVPCYGTVAYTNLYAGVDLALRGHNGAIKYEFVVRGGDPSQIRIAYGTGRGVRLQPSGGLVIDSPLGALRDQPPVSYQPLDGGTVPVECRFTVDADGTVGFRVGPYNPAAPLVIDPCLSWSAPLSGAGPDVPYALACNREGDTYVTGYTMSPDFPATNAYDGTFNGGDRDAFVAKIRARDQALLFVTYLGGNSSEIGRAIALDSTGRIYVAGQTMSAGFPVTNGVDSTYNGGWDAFLCELSPEGDRLLSSSFIGGTNEDGARCLAIDGDDAAVLGGYTRSPEFPAVDGFDTSYNGDLDAFIAAFSPDVRAIRHSTFLGGAGPDVGLSLAIGPTGDVYLSGYTGSSNFPSVRALDPLCSGGIDAIVARMSPDLHDLGSSTYFGGTGEDVAWSLAVDAYGSMFIAGHTTSSNLPVLSAYDTSHNGDKDAFAAKLAPSGDALVYSTYVGGSGLDAAWALAVDDAGGLYLAGATLSSNFPVTIPPLRKMGGVEGFLAKLSPTGEHLAFARHVGGEAYDEVTAMSADGAGNGSLVGTSSSTNFPGLERLGSGDYGAFICQIAGDALCIDRMDVSNGVASLGASNAAPGSCLLVERRSALRDDVWALAASVTVTARRVSWVESGVTNESAAFYRLRVRPAL